MRGQPCFQIYCMPKRPLDELTYLKEKHSVKRNFPLTSPKGQRVPLFLMTMLSESTTIRETPTNEVVVGLILDAVI